MPAPALSRWTIALFAFALGSLLTLALAAGAYLVVSGYRKPAPSPVDDRPVFARPEFSRLVLGKAEAEVVQAVGKPDDTSEDNDGKYWHFKKRTRDPLTNEKDTDVQVVIKGGKVVNVNY